MEKFPLPCGEGEKAHCAFSGEGGTNIENI